MNVLKMKQKGTPCYKSHPVYKIGDYKIMGGSCTNTYPDVDVFIGLDHNTKMGKRHFPWNAGTDVYFFIPDMGVPKHIQAFRNLIKWTALQLKDGKSVFVGCIGGHGRTGLFLAALTTYMIGDKNSITTVRDKYCKKAVESNTQVEWLNKHFSINKTKATKKAISDYKKKQGSLDIPPWTDGRVSEDKPQVYMCVGGAGIIENNT